MNFDDNAPNRRTVLIVGFGYLGSRLSQVLKQNGHHVLATSRSPEKRQLIQNQGFEPVFYDINDAQASLPAADDWVWCPAFDRKAGLSHQQVVVEGLKRALSQTQRLPKKIVFTSTTSVYHQNDGSWVDEHTECRPASDSGKAHLEAEHFLMDWANLNQRVQVSLRLSGLYGPGRLIRKDALIANEPIACQPETWLNLLHIDDAAQACVRALKCDQSALYCVTDDRPILRREYYETAAQLLGAPAPRFVEPQQSDFAGNKRVSNLLFKTETEWKPQFIDISSGLKAIIGKQNC